MNKYLLKKFSDGWLCLVQGGKKRSKFKLAVLQKTTQLEVEIKPLITNVTNH